MTRDDLILFLCTSQGDPVPLWEQGCCWRWRHRTLLWQLHTQVS